MSDGTGGQPPVAVLAIDGGNSKTDVALVAADGTVLGTARGPGAPAQIVGMAPSFVVLDRLVTLAAERAGLGPRRNGPLAQHTAAFLAGADLAVEEAALDREVRARGWSVTTHVANDTFAVLRAGTSRTWGVAVVCGAGINCVGVSPDGRIARFPSLGQLTGDWGGGAALSGEVMWWATRSEDGRGPHTALQRAVCAHFARPTVHDVAVAAHLGQIAPVRLQTLTPVLFAVSADGDPIAQQIVDRMADEVLALGVVALRRLDLLAADTDIVLGGGVLTARDPRLLDRITAGFATQAPAATVRVVTVPPIAGAALLGLDRVAAGADAEARLRAAFGPERIEVG